MAIETLQEQTCRICGQNASASEIGRVINGYTLSKCTDCGTVQVKDPPELSVLKDVYDKLFSHGEYERQVARFEALKAGRQPPDFHRRQFLARVEKLTLGRQMTEIGGGTGSFGVLAKARGWNYKNYDISPVAVSFFRQLDLDAEAFASGEVPPLAPASADVIVMWEVLEHVGGVREYLDVIRRALRPGGIYLISTPNYKTPGFYSRGDNWGVCASPPVHLNFFDSDSLVKTLKAAGFKSVDIFRQRLYRPSARLRSWVDAIRLALSLDEARTLYAISR